ncbi:hypothetical protein GCM10026983_28760 [Gracilibacillus alcaliphilus]
MPIFIEKALHLYLRDIYFLETLTFTSVSNLKVRTYILQVSILYSNRKIFEGGYISYEDTCCSRTSKYRNISRQ